MRENGRTHPPEPDAAHPVVRLTIPLYPRPFGRRLRQAPQVWLSVCRQLWPHVWPWRAVAVANQIAYLVIRPIAGWPPYSKRLRQAPGLWWWLFREGLPLMNWRNSYRAASRLTWQMLTAPAPKEPPHD